jgi:hypothetical protein
MSQLGRISGPLLNDILNRDGVDLSFETNLLYLDVDNGRIGINQPSNVPSHDLDIYGYTRTTNLEVTSQATIDNVRITAPNTFTTVTGPLYITPEETLNPYIQLERVLTGQLEINGNQIRNYQTNGSIVLNPNASAGFEIEDTTNITGNLAVSGNIGVSGNLSAADNIIVGDNKLDVVQIAPDFTQDIIPGVNLDYDLGADAADSSQRRWAELYIRDDLTHTGLVLPLRVNVSDQFKLDGNNGQIYALQSNDDLIINPDTGITYIERTKWENNYITNLNNTPISIGGTGTGYVKFNGTNAILIPAGTSAERYGFPEVGMTRWNTELELLECWDGSNWITSLGPGTIVDVPFMEDLGNVYNLILG